MEMLKFIHTIKGGNEIRKTLDAYYGFYIKEG